MEIAAAVWMILILSIAAAVIVVAWPSRRAADPAPAVTLEEARHATELAVAADRAAGAAARLRREWSAAQDEVDAAWVAYERAESEARRFAAAAVYPVQRRRRNRGENAERERFLHRSALAACRHRQISIAQLNDVLAHRGWNERLHPAAQESALRQAVRDHRYELYLQATARERLAWAGSEQAAERLRGLRADACRAGLRRDEEDTLAMDGSWWSRRSPVRVAAA